MYTQGEAGQRTHAEFTLCRVTIIKFKYIRIHVCKCSVIFSYYQCKFAKNVLNVQKFKSLCTTFVKLVH